jgi:PAS domain S-box-containing protein
MSEQDDRRAEFFRQAFLATDDPAIVTDENFEILDANQACLNVGDWEREELIGEYPYVLFEDPSMFEAVVQDVTEGRRWRGDFDAKTNDGRQVSGEGTVAPITIDGETVGYVAIFVDLTSRRKQEESLRVLNRVLRHNLRNDANVVLGHLETAAGRSRDEEVQHSIAVATRRVQAILDRARTTREFSRLVESDDPALFPVRVDAAVDQAVRSVDAGTASVSVDVPEGLFVLADETVTAALRNVVENAIEHGGDAPTVEVSAEADDERVRVHVADDGPGIEEDRRDRVLERGGTDVYHSQGLGLFFVDRLLDVYGGDLSIAESDMGGCLVTLSFPRTTPEKHGLE